MIQQTLATGIHGILFCNARTAGGVRAFVEASLGEGHEFFARESPSVPGLCVLAA